MDNIDRNIINRLQGGFPVCEYPYARVATELDLTEDDLIQRLQKLLDDGVLSRFGPMYNADRMGGAFTLCAMSVPEENFDDVADYVNGFDEVAHNYKREHTLNMWFVLGTRKPERIAEVIHHIETHTGYKVSNMPKQEEFFVELKLSV
jgi:DNA-binding Lrp family transcriptional regulator